MIVLALVVKIPSGRCLWKSMGILSSKAQTGRLTTMGETKSHAGKKRDERCNREADMEGK